MVSYFLRWTLLLAYPNHRSMNRVNAKCAVLLHRTRATSLWHHKITSKYYEVGQENWHFIFIKMRPLPAYLRENFKSFLSGAFRIKFFIWRYCKYKEWASYFSAFMGNELGWGSDKSSENRFAVHGNCHVPHPSSFSHERRKKDTHSLNKSDTKCKYMSLAVGKILFSWKERNYCTCCSDPNLLFNLTLKQVTRVYSKLRL